MLVTLLASLGILILLGDGSKQKKILAIIMVIGGIIFLLTSGIVLKLFDSFSTTGDLAGSSIARVGAYEYYLNTFLKNPMFAIGFAGDNNYYDIVHGTSGIYYQSVYVRYYYDDVGIVGQLALLGIFVVGIYIWPLLRIIKIAIRYCKSKLFSEGKLAMAIACYLVCTTPTLIVLDSNRVFAWPIVLATIEFSYTNYLKESKKKKVK
jgi:O-antigen ligase